jgi:hypothetical protein
MFNNVIKHTMEILILTFVLVAAVATVDIPENRNPKKSIG